MTNRTSKSGVRCIPADHHPRFLRSGPPRLARFTALRAVCMTRWRGRLQIEKVVLCLLLLGAKLPRVVGLSSFE